MADFELRFNEAELIAGAEEAFGDFNLKLGEEFQKRITENRWPWPTGDSPRDIVLKGQLRDSHSVYEISKTEYVQAWSTDYAMAVHEGAQFGDGRSMPGRPWIRDTIKEVDTAEMFGKLASIEMAKRTAGK